MRLRTTARVSLYRCGAAEKDLYWGVGRRNNLPARETGKSFDAIAQREEVGEVEVERRKTDRVGKTVLRAANQRRPDYSRLDCLNIATTNSISNPRFTMVNNWSNEIGVSFDRIS